MEVVDVDGNVVDTAFDIGWDSYSLITNPQVKMLYSTDPTTNQIHFFDKTGIAHYLLSDELVDVPEVEEGLKLKKSKPKGVGKKTNAAVAMSGSPSSSGYSKVAESISTEACKSNAVRAELMEKTLQALQELQHAQEVASEAAKQALQKAKVANLMKTQSFFKNAADAEKASEIANQKLADATRHYTALVTKQSPSHVKALQNDKDREQQKKQELKKLLGPYEKKAPSSSNKGIRDANKTKGKQLSSKSPKKPRVDVESPKQGHSLTKTFCLLRWGNKLEHPSFEELNFLTRCGMGNKSITIPSSTSRSGVLAALTELYPILNGEPFKLCTRGGASTDLDERYNGPVIAPVLKELRGIVYIVPNSDLEAVPNDDEDEIRFCCKVCFEYVTYLTVEEHMAEHEMNDEKTIDEDWKQKEASFVSNNNDDDDSTSGETDDENDKKDEGEKELAFNED